MDSHPILTSRVLELAKKKGYSINRLADFSGISRGHLSNVLRGQMSPTLKTLDRIAEALDVQAKDLLEGAPKTPSE
jgi:transcriptional regulator with XRE-family HTH domain